MSPDSGGRRATHAAPRFVAPMRRVPRMGIGTPRRPLRPTPRFFSRTPDCGTGEWAGSQGPKKSWFSGDGTAWSPAESRDSRQQASRQREPEGRSPARMRRQGNGVASCRAGRITVGVGARVGAVGRDRQSAEGDRVGVTKTFPATGHGDPTTRLHLSHVLPRPLKTAPVPSLAATSPHGTRPTSGRDFVATRRHSTSP